MLVSLVPPSINHLGQRRVFVEAFKFFVWYRWALVLVLTWPLQRVEGSRVRVRACYRCRFGRLRRVVKNGSVESGDLVEQEIVKVVVLA